MTGRQLVIFAKLFIGFKYVLGVVVPKDKKDYKGAFDCAEFVAYCIYQVYGFLYGTLTNNLKRAAKEDAYTGYFNRDVLAKGIQISIEEAEYTEGAILLRNAGGTSMGHIAISQGNGLTMEAHSTKKGVIPSVVTGRRWSKGILLPNVIYTPTPEKIKIPTKAPAMVYRLKSPLMKDAFIGKLQKALGIHVDEYYGVNTELAVTKFQSANGLVVDGEVMPKGETAKALGIDL
jgi:N-acetylmuramoyl-L-alanine amidase